MKERFHLLKIAVVNSYQIDTAYLGERWVNLLSTCVYVLTYLFFIHVLYANVKTIAGYTYNEMLFFTFIGQLSFYTMWTAMDNLRDLIDDINSGNLDLILIKPLPTLFYITFRKMSIITIMRDAIPLLFIMGLLNWHLLHFNLVNVLLGIVIFICGQITINTFQLLLTLPAFWFGQSSEIFNLGFIPTTEQVPFDGLSNILKVLFTTIIPIFFSVSVTASVLLNKSNPFVMSTIALIITSCVILIRNRLWQWGVRNYSSASS